MKDILVLCTGNSCRSIMAEALINHLGAGRYHAVSAGSKPAGYVHPKSIEILQQQGICLGEPHSKSWNVLKDQRFDWVITVCDTAVLEPCPVFLGNNKKQHWSTPDPAIITGSQEDINTAFYRVYILLKNKIQEELL